MEDDEGLQHTPINHESLFARIAARSAEKIVDDFDKPIRSRELRLLGLDRDKINEIREGIDQRRGDHTVALAALEADQLEALQYIPESKADVKVAAVEKLRERIKELNTLFLKEQLAHINTVDYSVSLALEAFYDTNTPLFARKAFVRTLNYALVTEQLKQLENPQHEPMQWHLGIKDGMLFHAGNTIRSMSGFDRGLHGEASAQIAVSKVFSGEYCPYQPFRDESEMNADQHLQKYVLNIPENNALFQELRNLVAKEGNRYEEFRIRVNAGGGDEFLDVYGVSGPDAQRMVQLGRELKKGITNVQVLSPEYDILNPTESRSLTQTEIDRRNWLRNKYPNSVNAFKVPGDGPEANLLRDFWDRYRGYLMNAKNARLNSVFMDKDNDICFDMAEYDHDYEHRTLPTIDDGITLFIAGIDSKGTRLTNGEGEPLFGFYTPEGLPDDGKIDLYAQTISDRVRSQYSGLDIDDTDGVVKVISGMIQEDMLNGYVDYLNDQVNKVAKPRKKLEVLRNAYKYEPVGRDVFNVAATYATGRDVFVELNPQQRAELTVSVIKDIEQAMKEHHGDPALKQLQLDWDLRKAFYMADIRNRSRPYSEHVSSENITPQELNSLDFDVVFEKYITPPERRQQGR